MYDLIVIGAGPAGLAAAKSAADKGLEKILLVERNKKLGGILNQCIHNGFGLSRFKEELTGPEYAARYIEMLEDTSIEVRTDTMVLDVKADKTVCMVSPCAGYTEEKAKAVILAMGCRERSRGGVIIPGTRPAGIYTAGAAQKYINIDGYLPGNRVVILGSGDIGLIMARRLTLEGAKVLAVVEINPYSSGLPRNISQCLNDFDIPLLLEHTVTEIRGRDRVEQVVVSRVEAGRPVPGSEMIYDCDTLLLSVGLIPENELSSRAGVELDPATKGPFVFENMETLQPGIFTCGNVCHVHDLVDLVSAEAELAGKQAASYVLFGEKSREDRVRVLSADGVSAVVPQFIHRDGAGKSIRISFRVTRNFERSAILIKSGGKTIKEYTKAYMTPGEMQSVILTEEMLKEAGEELSLSAVEAQND